MQLLFPNGESDQVRINIFFLLILDANLCMAFEATAPPNHEKISLQKVAFSTSITLSSHFAYIQQVFRAALLSQYRHWLRFYFVKVSP